MAGTTSTSTPESARPGRSRGSLTADEVVAAAIELIDAEGIGKFSMRRLAGRLEVNPMTIYLRFDSKSELLEAVVAAVVGEIDVPEDGPWEARAEALAVGMYTQLCRCRGILPMLDSNRSLAATMLRATESGLALMVEIGYRDAAAVTAYRSLAWHAMSWAIAHDSIEARIGEAIDAEGGTSHAATPLLDDLLPHFEPIEPHDLFTDTTRALVEGLHRLAPALTANSPGAST